MEPGWMKRLDDSNMKLATVEQSARFNNRENREEEKTNERVLPMLNINVLVKVVER